jgi:endoglycosylceramidase
MLAGGIFAASCAASSSPVTIQYSSPSMHPGAPSDQARVMGPLTSPGGPYLFDSKGRVVFLHGVNLVYKHAPYVVTLRPGTNHSFTLADALRIERLGFNVVRLGIIWAGIEPGHGGINQPGVCTPGAPTDPHMWNQRVAMAYVSQVRQVMGVLNQAHLMVILDMHQDVWNQVFRGEGAPAWAVCAGGPVVVKPGRWSIEYGSTSLITAMNHFWRNDVIGNLQGEYDRSWAFVASQLKDQPNLIGYDPFNEPISSAMTIDDRRSFATALECFYTGTAHPGRIGDTTTPMTCPTHDPVQGVIPVLEHADRVHLIFVEPDLYTVRSAQNRLGPMPFGRLVYNIHIYCSQRSPLTGDPTNLAACADHIASAFANHSTVRLGMGTRAQRHGPAWLLTEFGATQDPALAASAVASASFIQIGWIYWSWAWLNDPTGSTHEGLVSASGAFSKTKQALSVPYPEAVAGTPLLIISKPLQGTLDLSFRSSAKATAPTAIVVPPAQYPYGWCTIVTGGTITSPAGTSLITIDTDGPSRIVEVVVTPGRCTSRAAMTAIASQ